MNESPAVTGDSAWADAERVAARHRDQRTHPSTRRTRRDRILVPIVVACWLTAVAFALAGLLTPGDRGYDLGFASYGGLLLFAVLGGWWSVSSGRYIVRGSAASIRAAIPQPARKQVQRQLALREPLDRRHADVVLELAHQGRDLVLGQVALYAFYVPLYLNIARSTREWIGPVVLAAGSTALVVGVILLIFANGRLTRLIRHHEPLPDPEGDAAPSTRPVQRPEP